MIGHDNIPFLDLVAPHLELEEELVSVFRSVLKTAGFVGGPMLEEFEREFAHFCGVQYCVGVGSGTDALRFALMAAGVKPGDTVVTVPNTFIATAEAISQAGARPDFVDVQERTFNMDPRKLREYLETSCRLNPATGKLLSRKMPRPVTAIVPVHLYGQTADMDPILELAELYSLIVVEDACQAHGAEYFSKKQSRWKRAGSMGHAAAFSFYPGKNLGACGEAGAVTTNDGALAQTVRMLRDHGQAKKYFHDLEGYNGRLDSLQAGILSVKLRHLAEWNHRRRERAGYYHQVFTPLGGSVTIPHEPQWSKSAYHHYVIRTEHRDQLKAYLDEAGIGTGIHYPVAIHLQKAYRSLGCQEGDFPVAEKAARAILSLPIYPQLSFDRQKQIVERVQEFLSTKTVSTQRLHTQQVPAH